MRATRLVAAAVLAAAAFATTPASAHHGDAVCHGADDVWLGPYGGIDNPTTGPQQGVITCVYVGTTRYIVGLGDDRTTGHHCLTVYYAISGAYLGCYL